MCSHGGNYGVNVTPADWVGQAVGPVSKTIGPAKKVNRCQKFGPFDRSSIDFRFGTVGQADQRNCVTMIRLCC